MAEYIEREAAIKAIRNDVMGGLNAEFIVNELPAADVREVKRGHIEEDENTYLWCSECGCNITLAAYEMPNGNLILRPNYCPMCGRELRRTE